MSDKLSGRHGRFLIVLLLLSCSLYMCTIFLHSHTPSRKMNGTATLEPGPRAPSSPASVPPAPSPPRSIPPAPSPPEPNTSPDEYFVQPQKTTFVFPPAGDEVDCDLVLSALKRLYQESKARHDAWRGAGMDLMVDDPRDLNVTELHILMIGDYWSERESYAILRHLDACRMTRPEPLIERDECAIHFISEQYGGSMYQLSKAALGLGSAATPEGAGFLRVHVHHQFFRILSTAAMFLENVLRGPGPTPSITDLPFAFSGQCRRSLRERVKGMESQVPLCLCEDTIDRPDVAQRRVIVDAIQLFNGMWHTERPEIAFDRFSFTDKKANWYERQARFRPKPAQYPYITWEENVERVRLFHKITYTTVVRRSVADLAASAPAAVPLPRVLLSLVPRVNCSAPKYRKMTTINSRTRCEELTPPLLQAVTDAVRAAHGEPLLDLPAVPAPDWLRLVDYRRFSATEYPEHANYDGHRLDSGEYLCRMDDGSRFDIVTSPKNDAPHVSWCARHVHRLFWEEQVR